MFNKERVNISFMLLLLFEWRIFMHEAFERQRIFIAVKGVLFHDGKTLIVRRSEIQTPDGLGWWEFPGGTLEFGEQPVQTLVREFKEETCLEITPEQLLYVWSAQNNPEEQIIVITYLCQCGDISGLSLSEEHTEYMWVDKTSLRKYLAQDIKKALDANNSWERL